MKHLKILPRNDISVQNLITVHQIAASLFQQSKCKTFPSLTLMKTREEQAVYRADQTTDSDSRNSLTCVGPLLFPQVLLIFSDGLDEEVMKLKNQAADLQKSGKNWELSQKLQNCFTVFHLLLLRSTRAGKAAF